MDEKRHEAVEAFFAPQPEQVNENHIAMTARNSFFGDK
jgi:hypothetical protein